MEHKGLVAHATGKRDMTDCIGAVMVSCSLRKCKLDLPGPGGREPEHPQQKWR